MKRFDLADKVALVVGGGGYLGVPICRALAEHGEHVVIADVQRTGAENASRLLADDGLSTDAVRLDISDEDAVKAAIGDIVNRRGRLDMAVNTTLYSTGKQMQEMSLADWEAGLRVSLIGAFVFSREAGRVMCRSK